MDINIIYNDYFSKVFGGYNMAFPIENFMVRKKKILRLGNPWSQAMH